MRSLRMLLAGVAVLFATQALADETPPPPPDFGDCTVAKQKKNPAADCQECNGLLEDTCEKQFQGKGYSRSCQVKPKHASDWREVWCKDPAAAPPTPAKEPTKEPTATPPARAAAETTKEGGCTVSPEGSASWLWILGLGFVVSRRRK